MKFTSPIVTIAISATFLFAATNVSVDATKLAHKELQENVIENSTNKLLFKLRRGFRNLDEKVSTNEDSPSDSGDEPSESEDGARKGESVSISVSEDSPPSDSGDEPSGSEGEVRARKLRVRDLGARKLEDIEEESLDEDGSESISEDSPSISGDKPSEANGVGHARNLSESSDEGEGESERESLSLDEDESESLDEDTNEDQEEEIQEIQNEEILGQISLLELLNNATGLTGSMVGYNHTGESESESNSRSLDDGESESLDYSSDEADRTPNVQTLGRLVVLEERDTPYNMTDGMVGYNGTDESESLDKGDSESESESLDEDESESLDSSSSDEEEQEEGLNEGPVGQISLLELHSGSTKVSGSAVATAFLSVLMMGVGHIL